MLTPNVTYKKQIEYEPIPADVYQVVIQDVEEREGKNFRTNAPEPQFFFKCQIVEGDYKNKFQNIFTTQNYFDGGKNAKPSKIYNLVKNVYAFYHPKVKVSEIEELTGAMINDMVGKQLRIAVELTETNRNKITSFMPIKAEVKQTTEDISAEITL